MIATQSTEAAPAPTRATVVYLPHENLHECILNPRKEFKPGPLEELSKNIEEMGVKQPLLVRPSRTVAGQYEIIAGARRWRGNGMALDRVVNYDDVEQVHRLVAKLGELPCMVEDMSDVQAREFMLVENLQREDLTVVEEADGYADLLALKGEDGQPLYTVAKIAERIGRSESHVTQRLKLRRAPKRLLEACEKGVIGSRHCELVGRIPDVEAREELAKAILAPQMRDKDLPLNVRETVALIRRDYMLSLKGCGFDVDDAELLPVQFSAQGERLCGGACMGCPFRSGNDASLQEELKVVGGQSGGGSMGVDPHVCTKPSCFRRKQEAAWKLVVASAEGSGKNVLSVQGAKAVFVEGSVRGDSEYVDLAAKPRPQDVGHYDEDSLPKWEQVVKGSPCEVKVTVARNPDTGRIHQLVKRDEAIEAANQAAKAKGATSLFGKRPAAGSGDGAFKAAERKRAEEKKVAVAESYEALNALGEAVVKRGGYGEDEGLVVLQSLLGMMNAQGVMVMGKALKLQPRKRGEPGYQGSGRDFILPILEHYKAADYTRPKLEAYVVMCLAGERLGFVDGDSPVAKNEPFLLLARTFGVDMDAVKRLAKVDAGKGKGKTVNQEAVDAAKMVDRRVALEKELVDLYVQAGNVYDDDDLEHTDELVKWLDIIAKDNGLKPYSDPNHGLADAELIVLAARRVVEELGVSASVGSGQCVSDEELSVTEKMQRCCALENDLVCLYEAAGHTYIDDVQASVDEFIAWVNTIAAEGGLPDYRASTCNIEVLEELVAKVRAAVAELKGEASLDTPVGTVVAWVSGGHELQGEVISREDFTTRSGVNSLDLTISLPVYCASPERGGLQLRLLDVDQGGVTIIAAPKVQPATDPEPPKGGTPTSPAKIKSVAKKAAKKAAKKVPVKKAGKKK